MINLLSAATKSDVSRETSDRLDRYRVLLLEENARQNLISKGSVEDIWSRHLLDSAQLLGLADKDANWVDIGSGPGLPGLVLAILGVRQITLIEPRRLRTDFLARCVADIGLGNVQIVTGRAENLTGRYDVITARAVAPLPRMFAMCQHLARPDSQWVLPKGRAVANELVEAQVTWQGAFKLEPSLTDPDARILVASGVRRKAGRG